MDSRTAHEIDMINASIPSELRKHLVETKNDDELQDFQEKVAHLAKRNPRLRKLVSRFPNTSRDVLNPKVAHEIERYLQVKIDSAIRSGRLPRATKDDYQRFVYEMQHKHP